MQMFLTILGLLGTVAMFVGLWGLVVGHIKFLKIEGRLKAAGLILVGLVVVGLTFDEEAAEEMQLATQAEEMAAQAEEAAEEAQCRQDLSCWAEKHLITAEVFCEDGIERLGQYDHEWTNGFMERKFSRYRWQDQDKGIVTYLGDKINFGNAFGAMSPHTYSCDFDPNTDSVLDVRGEQGRLPS